MNHLIHLSLSPDNYFYEEMTDTNRGVLIKLITNQLESLTINNDFNHFRDEALRGFASSKELGLMVAQAKNLKKLKLVKVELWYADLGKIWGLNLSKNTSIRELKLV